MNNISPSESSSVQASREELRESLQRWRQDPNETGDKAAAIAKILSAFMTRSNHLDLSRLRLDTVPFGIEKLTNIKFLDLSHNNIRWIPLEMENLKCLCILNISNNPSITYLPLLLGKIANLTHVHKLGTKISRHNLDEVLALSCQLRRQNPIYNQYQVKKPKINQAAHHDRSSN